VAEDTTVRICKRGHPRIPENIGASRNCKACEHLRDIGRATYWAAYRLVRNEERAARNAAWYESLSGIERNQRLLRGRRSKALGRMARRHSREETS
jgi:hypothetical protein